MFVIYVLDPFQVPHLYSIFSVIQHIGCTGIRSHFVDSSLLKMSISAAPWMSMEAKELLGACSIMVNALCSTLGWIHHQPCQPRQVAVVQQQFGEVFGTKSLFV